MKIIWADFNARTMSGHIILSIPQALKSIKEVGGIEIGEEVILTDGKLHVKAEIITLNGGVVLAHPKWDTMKRSK